MNKILPGDCLDVMRTFPDNHFSAIVTDPPYGLHFMGKGWDKFKKTNFDENTDKYHEPSQRNFKPIYKANTNAGTYDERRNCEFEHFIYEFGKEALRILKPGGYVLMFGAPRRYHRQACGLEDAGFEIRDCMQWIFGSGFPKSHNNFGIEGYGTALKPAYEPIIVAMKPCDGTFAQNAEKWGQAGINIDGCRIETDEKWTRDTRGQLPITTGEIYNGGYKNILKQGHSLGRWPANVLFDEKAAALLDEQSGVSKECKSRQGGIRINGIRGSIDFKSGCSPTYPNVRGDSGGASRFFYCAKSSSSERNAGLEGMSLKNNQRVNAPRENEEAKTSNKMANHHPTVKPIKLMEYLIKLVMPPSNGLLLDPFAGSGSTIVAAKRLGFDAIGIEKETEYVEIAQKRVDATTYVPEQYELNLSA